MHHVLRSLSSVEFHTLTLELPIQTQNSVAPELQVFVSSLEISAKRAQPWGSNGNIPCIITTGIFLITNI